MLPRQTVPIIRRTPCYKLCLGSNLDMQHRCATVWVLDNAPWKIVFSTHNLPLLNLLCGACSGFGVCGLNFSRLSYQDIQSIKSFLCSDFGLQVWPMTAPLIQRLHSSSLQHPKLYTAPELKPRCGVLRCFTKLHSWCTGRQEPDGPSSSSVPPVLRPPQPPHIWPQAQNLAGTSVVLPTGDKPG